MSQRATGVTVVTRIERTRQADARLNGEDHAVPHLLPTTRAIVPLHAERPGSASRPDAITETRLAATFAAFPVPPTLFREQKTCPERVLAMLF